MNRFGFSATIVVATLCFVTLPAVARKSEGANPSVPARVNLPQWPAQPQVKSNYRSVPEFVLLSKILIPPRPENLALGGPVAASKTAWRSSSEPRPISTAGTLKASAAAPVRQISRQKLFSSHRKSVQPAAPKLYDRVFIGGLY
jgi:hypothetical protein